MSHESGPVPDWIQLEIRAPSAIEHYTVSGSIVNPAESANPGMLAVGATHYWDTSTFAYYSSQGPTPDRRVKPDIVGVACGETASYPHYSRNGQDCWFAGTSQASPHVAGMAALVKQLFPDFTPEQVANYLKDNTQQRGSPDPDNTWGYGFAVLPPPGGCEAAEIAADGSPVAGSWGADCVSAVREGRQARYYQFTLTEDADITVQLQSDDAETVLYLREGPGRHLRRPHRIQRRGVGIQLPPRQHPADPARRRNLHHRGHHLQRRRNRFLHLDRQRAGWGQFELGMGPSRAAHLAT